MGIHNYAKILKSLGTLLHLVFYNKPHAHTTVSVAVTTHQKKNPTHFAHIDTEEFLDFHFRLTMGNPKTKLLPPVQHTYSQLLILISLTSSLCIYTKEDCILPGTNTYKN